MNGLIKFLLRLSMDLVLLITVQTLVTFIVMFTGTIYYGDFYITTLLNWTIRLISAILYVFIQLQLMKRRNK